MLPHTHTHPLNPAPKTPTHTTPYTNQKQAALTVKVGHHAGGGFGFPQFPQWLGKNSTTNKR